MLNRKLKLNEGLWKSSEKESNRNGFGRGLVSAGRENKNVVALVADLKDSLCMNDFAREFPNRFIEVGVAEQNVVTVSSGMARMGKIPFAGSYAVFSPGRNWEQIRTTICYNNVPVKIVGSHAGLSVGADGGSHQALEDIALMTVLPNMYVFSPCDSIEAEKITRAMSQNDRPNYLRLCRDKTQLMTTKDTPFEIGKIYEFYRSTNIKSNEIDIAIFATGPILFECLNVAKKMSEHGRGVAVFNVPTIKPLDEYALLKVAHEAKAIVTVEDHQKIGGLGAIISLYLSQHFPTPIEIVAVNDVFGQSGSTKELYDHYGLTEIDIYKACERAILRKE
jgi:transketolase